VKSYNHNFVKHSSQKSVYLQNLNRGEAAKKARFTRENLRAVRATVYLAQEVGKSMGRGEILQ